MKTGQIQTPATHIKMTKKESKQIDATLMWAIVASNRNADKGKLLSAFAFDINRIRSGKEPTATKELV
jgi:hypothetical protein